MTDDEPKALVASLAVAQQKTDRKLEFIIERIDYIELMLGSLRSITNDFFCDEKESVEKYFYNYFVETKCLDLMQFDTLEMLGSDDYNIKLVNDYCGNLIYTKAKFKITKKDLHDFEIKLKKFKKQSPYYENYKLYGAIASFHINDDAKKDALERGFFVLQRKGKVVQTDCSEHLMVL
jgi:hypothetical protein